MINDRNCTSSIVRTIAKHYFSCVLCTGPLEGAETKRLDILEPIKNMYMRNSLQEIITTHSAIYDIEVFGSKVNSLLRDKETYENPKERIGYDPLL